MATKTYQTIKPSLSLSLNLPAVGGGVKTAPLFFTNGLLTTDDTSIQAFIEGLPSFKSGDIWLQDAAHLLAEAQAELAVAKKAAASAQAAVALAQAKVEALTPAASAAPAA